MFHLLLLAQVMPQLLHFLSVEKDTHINSAAAAASSAAAANAATTTSPLAATSGDTPHPAVPTLKEDSTLPEALATAASTAGPGLYSSRRNSKYVS